MARPQSFPEQTDILNAPDGMPDCLPLPCYRDGEQVISVWKLSPAELAEIVATGVVWLGVHGRTQPPVYLTGNSPFDVQKH